MTLKAASKKYLIGHEMEISKKEAMQHRPKSSPKRRMNYDVLIKDSQFARDRPMSRSSRDRPYSSPQKTDVRINAIVGKPLNETARQYDDQDILFHKKYQKIKRLAEQSSSHIQHVLNSIELAYLNNQERPKTAKDSIRPVSAYDPGMSFERAARSLKNDIEFLKTHKNKPLSHPEWNEQFVYGKALSPRVQAPVAPIHKIHDNFVKSMSKFSSHSVDPLKDASIEGDLPWKSPFPATPSVTKPTTANSSQDAILPAGEEEAVHVIDRNGDAEMIQEQDALAETIREAFAQTEYYDSISSEDNTSRFAKANEVWSKMVSRLHSLGKEIQYSDLYGLSILREPPAIVAAILGYCAILMGLKPDWSTIRSTLLKEARIFHNFLKEVRIHAMS